MACWVQHPFQTSPPSASTGQHCSLFLCPNFCRQWSKFDDDMSFPHKLHRKTTISFRRFIPLHVKLDPVLRILRRRSLNPFAIISKRTLTSVSAQPWADISTAKKNVQAATLPGKCCNQRVFVLHLVDLHRLQYI